MRRRGTAPDEGPPSAWVSEDPRLELLGPDRPDGGAADRSSVVDAVARASSRTKERERKEKAMRKRKRKSRMHLLMLPTVPALRDARSATQGQRQGFFICEQRFARG